MPGLFDNLFSSGDAPAAGGGLFSPTSRFASVQAVASVAPTGSAPPPTTAAAGGGKKRKHKPQQQEQQEQQQQQPPVAAQDEQKSKKPRKDKAQQRVAHEQQGAAAAAAAAAARAAHAADEQAAASTKQPKAKKSRAAAATIADAAPAKEPKAEQPKKEKEKQKEKKTKKKEREGAGPEAAPAAAAAEPAAAQPKQPPVAGSQEREAGKEAAASAGPGAGKSAAGNADADDPRLPRTVFVGNLPATVKRKALARLFAGCGEVESTRLRSLPLKQHEAESKLAKLPRRGAIAAGHIDVDHSAHAYVVFKEEAAVGAALRLNMTQFEGHHLRVDRAAPKAAKGTVQFEPTRSLFVGNLPLDTEDEELVQLFGAGSLEAVRVVRDGRTGAGKGVAFVMFRTHDASRAALKQHGRSAELKGRKLRLSLVKKEGAAGSKGKPAAWQQGKSGDGAGDKPGGKKASKAKVDKPVAGKRKAGNKRPSVAARKASATLKARAGGVQKR